MFDYFKSQATQKFLALGLLLFLLITIPVVVWFGVQQEQTTQNHAAPAVPQEQHYACGGALTVLLSVPTENPPACSSGSASNLTSFQSTVILKAQAGSQGAYHVKWAWAQYWCPTEDPHAPCLQNGTLATSPSGGDGLTGNGSAYVTAASAVKTPTAEFAGQACGYYQNDFGFQVFDNDTNTQQCGISLDLASLGQTNNNASWCHSNNSCTTVTATPTNTPTPTTVTTTPTNTPTPTTVTNTPTPTTLTPGPSNTPTPVVLTTTPKPSLPPTGPGDTIVGIGLVGAAAAIIGTIVILAI